MVKMILNFLGYAALVGSFLALIVVFHHWSFFRKSQKNRLAKKMALVCLADLVTQLSMFLYSLNLTILGPDDDTYRVALKAIQVIGIVLTVYAVHRLMTYYKSVV